MTDAEETDKFDKMNAARHEAAHATVAAASGRHVMAWVCRNPNGGDEERFWGGKTQLVNGDWTPAIKLAGVATECDELFDTVIDPDWAARCIVDYWRDEIVMPSPTDLAGLPRSWKARHAAVLEAVTVLRDNRKLFDWIAAELFENDVLTDGMIRDAAREMEG